MTIFEIIVISTSYVNFFFSFSHKTVLTAALNPCPLLPLQKCQTLSISEQKNNLLMAASKQNLIVYKQFIPSLENPWIAQEYRYAIIRDSDTKHSFKPIQPTK